MDHVFLWMVVRYLLGKLLALDGHEARRFITPHQKFSQIDGGSLDLNDITELARNLSVVLGRENLPVPGFEQTLEEYLESIQEQLFEHAPDKTLLTCRLAQTIMDEWDPFACPISTP